MSQTAFDFKGSSLHRENSRQMESFLIDNSVHFDGQCKKVWELLIKGERLTVKGAMNAHDINSLPRRILDIKRMLEKNRIKKEIKTERVGKIVEYFL